MSLLWFNKLLNQLINVTTIQLVLRSCSYLRSFRCSFSVTRNNNIFPFYSIQYQSSCLLITKYCCIERFLQSLKTQRGAASIVEYFQRLCQQISSFDQKDFHMSIATNVKYKMNRMLFVIFNNCSLDSIFFSAVPRKATLSNYRFRLFRSWSLSSKPQTSKPPLLQRLLTSRRFNIFITRVPPSTFLGKKISRHVALRACLLDSYFSLVVGARARARAGEWWTSLVNILSLLTVCAQQSQAKLASMSSFSAVEFHRETDASQRGRGTPRSVERNRGTILTAAPFW